MSTGRNLAMVGGALAFIAGVVSLATQKPLAYHLFNAIGVGFPEIKGVVIAILGIIGMAGGLGAIYFASKGDAQKTMIAGVAGLLAPCGLAILSIIGGYLMQKEAGGK